MAFAVALLIVGLGLPGQSTQAKPNFSGKWVLLFTTEKGPAVVRELDVQHVPDKGTLTVSRRLNGPAYTDKYVMGSSGGTTVMGQRGPMTKGLRTMAWNGNELVISDITSITRDQDSGREERWTLDAQGRLTTVVTAWSPGGEDRTITVIYRKQTECDVCSRP